MKNAILATAAGLLLLTAAAPAAVVDGVVDGSYGAPVATDPSGVAGEGNGNAVMDLADLYVTDDGTNLYIALTIAADIGATDWGKYSIYILSPDITGSTPTHYWGRNIISTHGSNYQINTWVDSGGGANFTVWDENVPEWAVSPGGDQFAFAAGAVSVVEFGIPLINLGNPSSVAIAALSTGGGGTDNAQDIIPSSNGNAVDWSTESDIVDFVTYTMAPSSVGDWALYQ